MDGNRRWARARKLPILEGHEAGYQKLKEVIRWSKEVGIHTVYAYAFSTENWNRSKEEVGYLMNLLGRVVTTEVPELIKERVRVKFVGQIERFPAAIRAGLWSLEKATSKFTGLSLIICLSYGGRAEILKAVNEIIGEKPKKPVDEKMFAKHLWTYGYEDPELIIRTSGEIRTSNFMPWQAAYSEWFFTPTPWPALSRKEFDLILRNFSNRDIRRGR